MIQIIFAGGIHGVGKSTLCRELAAQLGLIYLSASDVLNWKDLNTDEKNKKVTDIPDTQDRLIRGLQAIVEPGRQYILDGHYCLFNKDGEVTPVPMDTFVKIAPLALIVVTGDPAQIAANLARRDAREYDGNVLAMMQERETDYARQVGDHLGVALHTFDKDQNQLDQLITLIHESLT